MFYQLIGVNQLLISEQRIMYLDNQDFINWMEKLSMKHTEGFFNLTEENLYKSQVIKDIDNNKAQ